MKNSVICFLLFQICTLCAFGQHSIEFSANSPRSGDKYTRVELLTLDPGASGRDVLWDFSDLCITDERQTIEINCDSDSVMVCYEPGLMTKYLITEDSLQCIGYETPLKLMNYSSKVPALHYPLYYGDIIRASFDGEGDYCKLKFMDNQGSLVTEADATGNIVVSEDDTLFNVIRLHTTRVSSVALFNMTDTLHADTIGKRRQEIEEHYQWFARGYRYPVFECTMLTSFHELEEISSIVHAYRCLPQDQVLDEDKVNEDILSQDSLARAGQADIIHYTARYDGYRITLDYSLDEPANLNVILCDRMGVLYFRKNEKKDAGDNYQIAVDCSGLKGGEYALYINVNGKVYSEKFQVN